MTKRNPHIGSNFDDFLKEEGIFEEVQVKALKSSVSHDEWMIEELRRDPKFAAEYLKQSMTDMSEPDGRGAALLALRRLAEAHGGMAAVAMEAGIQRESLYRALSPNGNPTMNTLIAVLKSLGMRLTVEPDEKAA